MACLLSTGFDYECDDSSGGIKQGSLLITQWENITASVVTAGEITTLTQAGGTSFFRYKIKKEIVGFDAAHNHAPEVGTQFFENVIQFALFKMSKEKNVEMKLLASKPVVIIAQDLNDIYHCIGLEFGAEKMGGTNNASTGKLFGEMNGYNIAFTDKTKNLYTVSTAVMASILIDGENS